MKRPRERQPVILVQQQPVGDWTSTTTLKIQQLCRNNQKIMLLINTLRPIRWTVKHTLFCERPCALTWIRRKKCTSICGICFSGYNSSSQNRMEHFSKLHSTASRKMYFNFYAPKKKAFFLVSMRRNFKNTGLLLSFFNGNTKNRKYFTTSTRKFVLVNSCRNTYHTALVPITKQMHWIWPSKLPVMMSF